MFDDYLHGLPEDSQRALRDVIDQVIAVAPEASEGHSYGVAAFRYNGKPLLGFAAAQNHLSLYPFSPAAVDAVRDDLDGYKISKGTIRFTVSRPVPAEVVRSVVGRRMAEIDAS